ncbi:MAG: extracellular solute-binding protein [Spirochaetaceae bacterium]|nr:extracellular solute-binding protein [Spirochaetaceae bacterium]MCF7939622.1 extracellular solute-binding protein [Spirochaetales bacterium]
MRRKGLCITILLISSASLIWAGGTQEDSTSAEKRQAKQTILLWDQYYRGVESEIMDKIVSSFQERNSDIEVERVTKTLDDLKMVLKMSVESGEGPDVMQVNQGEADMGAFVKADLLVNLNDVAAENNWEANFSESTLKAMGYNNDYYGISTTAEVVGFYYNKSIFEELNLSIPQSFSELEKLMADVKSAGYTPINFGNLDGWTGIHEWSAIQHVLTTRKELDNMMSGKPGDFWLNEANVQAAQILQDWVRKGYFTKDFSAIGYDDSTNVFYQGKSALMLTGNWLQGEMSQNAPFEVGFFLMPAQNTEKLKAIGGPGIPFVISKKAANRDAAIKFLDYLAQQETAKLWADELMLPAQTIDASEYSEADPLFQDILRAYARVNETNGMGYFIDWVTPTFYDTCSAAVQELMALEISPEEFAQRLHNDYKDYVE